MRAYVREVARRVEARLGAELVGIWLFGSCALGDFDPERSDVDIQAVTRGTLPVEERRALAAILSHDSLPCPARGLEFVLYAADDLTGPDAPRFQLNLNTGSDMPERLDLDAGGATSLLVRDRPRDRS